MGKHRKAGRHRVEQLQRSVPALVARRVAVGAFTTAIVFPLVAFSSVSSPHAEAAPADLRPMVEVAPAPMLLPMPPIDHSDVVRVAAQSEPAPAVTFDDELAAAFTAVEHHHHHHYDDDDE